MPENATPKVTPIHITLYDENSEIKAEYDRVFVPWGLLKQAVRMEAELDLDNMTEESMDALAALVAEAFGNQFSVKDLNEGADIDEMVAVLQTIINKARISMPGAVANPTRPGKARRR